MVGTCIPEGQAARHYSSPMYGSHSLGGRALSPLEPAGHAQAASGSRNLSSCSWRPLNFPGESQEESFTREMGRDIFFQQRIMTFHCGQAEGLVSGPSTFMGT